MYTSDEKDPEAMAEFWTKDMIWYGPCGIGASYTIPRYQLQHQFPFCDNLEDRESLGRKAFLQKVILFVSIQILNYPLKVPLDFCLNIRIINDPNYQTKFRIKKYLDKFSN